MSSQTTICDGRYSILGNLGQGGMSTVYRVHDTRLGVDRALKVLSPQMSGSKTIRDQFVAEAKIMARLQHPNVVAVQDIGQEKGLFFIVMELLEGGTAAQWVRRSGPMPPRLAVDVLLPILRALECAHQSGVVHRDVKPENIFLTAQGGAKIGDFGIAYVSAEGSSISKARTAQLSGTWAYMPPEQRNGAQLRGDVRADVYAAGSVLFFLLSGRPPLDLFASVDVPSLLEPLDGPLVQVIQRATRYDPSLRYPSITLLRDALEALLPSLPPLPLGCPPLVSVGVAAAEEASAFPVRAEFLTPLPPRPALPNPTLIVDEPEDITRIEEEAATSPAHTLASPRPSPSPVPPAPRRSPLWLTAGALGLLALLLVGGLWGMRGGWSTASPAAAPSAGTIEILPATHAALEVLPTPASSSLEILPAPPTEAVVIEAKTPAPAPAPPTPRAVQSPARPRPRPTSPPKPAVAAAPPAAPPAPAATPAASSSSSSSTVVPTSPSPSPSVGGRSSPDIKNPFGG